MSSPHRCSPRSQPSRMTLLHTLGGTTRHSRRRTAPNPPAGVGGQICEAGMVAVELQFFIF